MKTEYLESAQASDVGRKRTNNEDACLVLAEQGLFCVADGMGGGIAGELASETIVKYLQDGFSRIAPEKSESFRDRQDIFVESIEQANRWIHGYANEKGAGQMGSTVVGLIFDLTDPGKAVVLHAGDSRLYRLRAGTIEPLTHDHSAVAVLAAKLKCDPSTLPTRYQNELIRAVGLHETLELDQTSLDVKMGDVFLLCSDGLTRTVPDSEILKLLLQYQNRPAADVTQALVNAANDAGGQDNVTAVVIRVGNENKSSILPATTEKPAASMTRMPMERELAHAGIAAAVSPRGPAEPAVSKVERASPQSPPPPSSTVGEPKANPARQPMSKPMAAPRADRNYGAPAMTLAALLVAAVGIFFLLRPDPPPPKSEGTKSAPSHDSKALGAAPVASQASGKLTPQVSPSGVELNAATQNAEAALARGDYTGALAVANSGLAISPSDRRMQQIKSVAEQAIRDRLLYQDSLQKAEVALTRQEYRSALELVEKVLQVRPTDPNALRLRDRAQDQLAAANERDQKLRRELAAGSAAMERLDYATAIASARQALSLRSGDPAALALQSRAQTNLDLQAAQNAMGASDYPEVERIGSVYPSVDKFSALARAAREESSALAKARKDFDQGAYASVANLARFDFAAKAPFRQVLEAGAREQRELNELEALKKPGNAEIVRDRLSHPAAAAYRGKEPFRLLQQWAAAALQDTKSAVPVIAKSAGSASTEASDPPLPLPLPLPLPSVPVAAPAKTTLEWIKTEYESMLVWFAVKKANDPILETSYARSQTARLGSIDYDTKASYQKRVDVIEKEFEKADLLNSKDRLANLKELRRAIRSR